MTGRTPLRVSGQMYLVFALVSFCRNDRSSRYGIHNALVELHPESGVVSSDHLRGAPEH